MYRSLRSRAVLRAVSATCAGSVALSTPAPGQAAAPVLAIPAAEGGALGAFAGLAAYAACELQTGSCYRAVIDPAIGSAAYYAEYLANSVTSQIEVLKYGGAPPDVRDRRDWDWFHSPESWRPTMDKLRDAFDRETFRDGIGDEEPPLDPTVLRDTLERAGDQMGSQSVGVVESAQPTLEGPQRSEPTPPDTGAILVP